MRGRQSISILGTKLHLQSRALMLTLKSSSKYQQGTCCRCLTADSCTWSSGYSQRNTSQRNEVTLFGWAVVTFHSGMRDDINLCDQEVSRGIQEKKRRDRWLHNGLHLYHGVPFAHKLKKIANSGRTVTKNDFHEQWYLDWQHDALVRHLSCKFCVCSMLFGPR